MKNIIEQILDENNHDIIQIQGKNKEWLRFEQVALINLDEELFTILHPIAEDVNPDDVLVFRILFTENEAELILEENEQVIETCFDQYYQLYKRKK